jgi:hypothetical protein
MTQSHFIVLIKFDLDAQQMHLRLPKMYFDNFYEF